MLSSKPSKKKITIGDRFIKVGEVDIVWIVIGEGSGISSIPHFQVAREDRKSRIRTLSESTLLDSAFYLPATD